MDSLEKIYKKFSVYRKNCFLKDSDSWLGVSKTTLKNKQDIFNNYYEMSYYQFLTNLKNLVFSKDPFDFIEKGWGDQWEMETYLCFLKKENLISFSNNEIIVKNNYFKDIPKPLTEKEIKSIIQEKTGKKMKEKETVVSFINEFEKFEVKSELDQMPVSQSSAIFSVNKILDYIPLNKKFLFIGDDDFLSVFLSLADEKIESVVMDSDEDLLNVINNFALKFNLKIETRLIDTRKKTKPKESFVGFWCNPPYTEKGIKSFIEFGMNYLNKKGGNVFLAMGIENIGSRILFLQKYFNEKNLALSESISGRILYPYIDIHEEYKENLKRMKKYFDAEKIKKSSCLGADLLIFNYIPFKVKRVGTNNSIYSYL